MTLTDAGPLLAVIDRGDADHRACVDTLPVLAAPLVTTWPAFTEAMYLADRRVGWAGQERLWQLALRGDLLVMTIPDGQQQRAYELMLQYRSVPMDLADATLVVLAETLGVQRIFTLDRDFRMYRIQGRQAFDIVP